LGSFFKDFSIFFLSALVTSTAGLTFCSPFVAFLLGESFFMEALTGEGLGRAGEATVVAFLAPV